MEEFITHDANQRHEVRRGLIGESLISQSMSDNTSCMGRSCPQPWNPQSDSFKGDILLQFYFWVQGVAGSVVGTIGILGNLFLSAVFLSKGQKSTFHANLVVLAVFDTGYILSQLVTSFLYMIEYYTTGTLPPDPKASPNPTYNLLWPKLIWPLQNIFMVGSIYMTAVISVDRYMAIKHPFMSHFRTTTTGGSLRNNAATASPTVFCVTRKPTPPPAVVAKCNQSITTTVVDKKRVWAYGLGVAATSVMICIPMFFEYQVCQDSVTKEYGICETPLRLNMYYTWLYTLMADMVFRILLPLSLTMWANVAIYQTIKSSDSCQRESQVIAMLFGVAVPLLICHTYRFINNCSQTLALDFIKCCKKVTMGSGRTAASEKVQIVGQLLLIIQSSANCFIYLSVSKGFREKAGVFYRRFLACGGEMTRNTKEQQPSTKVRVRKLTDCHSSTEKMVFQDVTVCVIAKKIKTVKFSE